MAGLSENGEQVIREEGILLVEDVYALLSAVRHDRSLRTYDPSSFDDDIYGVRVHGRGRGRGFGTSEEYSLLDDENLMSKIGNRVLDILELLHGKGTLDADEILERLGIYLKDADGNTLEDWKEYANDLDDRITKVADDIEEALNQAVSGEGDDHGYDHRSSSPAGIQQSPGLKPFQMVLQSPPAG